MATSPREATKLPVSPFIMGETGNLVASWWQVGGSFLRMKLDFKVFER